MERIQELMDKGNEEAYFLLAGYYDQGIRGVPQDHQKAHELYLKAGELGCAEAYYNLGMSYENGIGVGEDKKKAKHYLELATMGGSVQARHNLGGIEWKAGNERRAFKQFIIAASSGSKLSLDAIKVVFLHGEGITKDEYANTLRAYHDRQKEMKSEMRDKAKAYNEARAEARVRLS